MKARKLVASLVAAFALSATVASAQITDDQRVADRISASIRMYPQFSIFDHVTGRVDDGAVVLTGKVTMPYKKEDIEKRVGKIDGVRSVKNEIDVLPVSQYDESLRYRISRAIYGNPSFWSYGAMANPPIHIIVENGRVTLTGVVFSNVDRMLARSLATGRGELSVVNELKTEMK